MKSAIFIFGLGVLTLVLAFSPVVHANDSSDAIPECLGDNGPIGVINDQVIQWKTSTRNQFLARGHVKGTVRQVYPDHSGHHHFELSIGNNQSDTIEVIYNEDFGATPDIAIGMDVEACGDYITSIAQSGPYPPSPDGAIIHWVHRAPNPQRHASGFIVVNGTLYGQDAGNAGPKQDYGYGHHRHH